MNTAFARRLAGRAASTAALAALIGATAGCAVPGTLGRVPTENDFAAIQPGWTSQQVLARFGRPTWVFGVRQENMTIWNYRYNYGDCIIYQVSMLPDGTVHDAGTGWDPSCNGGDGRG